MRGRKTKWITETVSVLVKVEISYEKGNEKGRHEAIRAALNLYLDVSGCGVSCGCYSAKAKGGRLMSKEEALQNSSSIKYRLVIGEHGNEQGHIIGIKATTVQGAKRALTIAMKPYAGDGWGRIEIGDGTPEGWQRI